MFEPPNLSANYTINGTEAIVSSGIILDVRGFEALEEEGEVAANMTVVTTNATDDTNATAVTEEGGGEEEFPPLPFPILDSFTMTFEEPGTYEYFCAFHPGCME